MADRWGDSKRDRDALDRWIEREPPIEWVRCILCGETMDRNEYDIHDCDIVPFEEADA